MSRENIRQDLAEMAVGMCGQKFGSLVWKTAETRYVIGKTEISVFQPGVSIDVAVDILIRSNHERTTTANVMRTALDIAECMTHASKAVSGVTIKVYAAAVHAVMCKSDGNGTRTVSVHNLYPFPNAIEQAKIVELSINPR